MTLLVITACTGAAAAPRPTVPATAERVLVVSIPGLLWSDVTATTTPNLHGFLTEAAVANLATKVTARMTEPGEAYATIGGANRAVAPEGLAATAFAPDEAFGPGTAADEYHRLTDVRLDGAAALLTVDALQGANDAEDYGGEVGTVGDALEDAGLSTAVVANADRPAPLVAEEATVAAPQGEVLVHREAVAALMGSDGIVQGGRVDPSLRVDDPDAAYGSRLDPDAVVAATTEAWEDGHAVVLVEASDLLLADQAGEEADGDAARALEDRALRWTDEVVGDLLGQVDPAHDAVMVLAPTPRGEPHLTVLGIRAPGTAAGLLSTAQTRTAGLVTLTDIGPTILDLAGVALPDGVEGRPAHVETAGAPGDEGIADLVDVDEAARDRDGLVGQFTRLYVALLVATVILATLAVVHDRRPSAPRALSLWLAAVLPCTYLARHTGVMGSGSLPFLLAMALGGVVLAALATVLARAAMPRTVDPLGPAAAVAGVGLVVLTVSVVLLDSALQVSTVFGDSPIVAGRFKGVNNLTFSQLTVGAILLATLSVRTSRRSKGAASTVATGAAAALLGAVLLVVGLPMWGADVGGVLAALPAFAVTGLGLTGRHLRWRAVLGWTIAAFVAVGVLGAVDLARPSDQRSHLARMFERVGDDGLVGLTSMVNRKLEQNLRTIDNQPWTVLLLVAAACVGFLLWRHRERLLAPWRDEPELRVAGLGLAVAMVLGWALNDSGVAVPGVMIAAALPAAVWVVLRPSDRSRAAGTAEPPAHRSDIDASPVGT